MTTAEPWSTWLLDPGGRPECRCDLRPSAALLGKCATSRDALKSADQFLQSRAGRTFPTSRSSSAKRAGRRKGARAAQPRRRSPTRPISSAPSCSSPMEKGYDYYLLEAYRPALEGRRQRRRGRRLLGPVRRQRPSQIRLHRPAAHVSPNGAAMRCWRAVLSLSLGLLILGRMPRVRQTGYLVMGGMIALVSTGLLALIDATALEYIDPTDIMAMIAMSPLVLLACAIILTEGIEMAASLWRVDRRAVRAAIPQTSAARLDPCADLQRAAADGDRDARMRWRGSTTTITKSSSWTTTRPIPRCGGRWRRIARRWARASAFSISTMCKGFKAGALNRALALTDPEATYIAVIDSDYQVEPFWLRRAMPLFRVARHRAGAGAAGLSRRRTRISSRPWPMRNIAASSISAWWSATNTTPSSSTAP